MNAIMPVVVGTLALVTGVLPAAATAASAAPSLRALDFQPAAASADGSVIVGTRWLPNTDTEAVRWTAAGGAVGLGYLRPGHRFGEAVGVSADGTAVVGRTYPLFFPPQDAAAQNDLPTFYWTAEHGMVDLSLPAGARPGGLSGDGRVIVGQTINGAEQRAFRWTAQEGFVLLDKPVVEYATSWANAASADGTVVVGGSGSVTGNTPTLAFRWTAVDGMVTLGSSASAPASAVDVSADGSVVVGFATQHGGPAGDVNRAFRWTADSGMVALDASSQHTAATGVSADGSVIVGLLEEDGEDHLTAFIWDQANGMRRLRDVLTGLGVGLNGLRLDQAVAISADGSTIVGKDALAGHQPVPWVATIPEPAALPSIAFAVLGLAGRRRRRASLTGTAPKAPRRPNVLGETSLAFAITVSVIPAAAAPVFELVATHPDAAAQPTALGQSIQTLKPFNGKLYAGYGDYFTNTGPIAVRAFDPATGSFGPALLSAQTEALLIYREVGGKLYAPHVDPWPSPPPPEGELGGYSLGAANGATETWSDHRLVSGIHMLDVATFDGSDLWIAGSRANATGGTDAVAWRSRDGGATWQASLVVPPQRAGATIARLYAIQAYNGRLYTQGQDSNPGDATWGPHTTSKVFDGTSWTDGPSLGGGLIGNMWHPEPFAGELVWDRLHGGTAGRMSKFDGTRTALAYPDFNTTIHDYTIDGDVLYALISDGRIVRTSDLVTWSLLDTAPASARSLGVLDGTLYVGGTGGQLFRYGVPVPEPAAVPLLALAALALRRTRRLPTVIRAGTGGGSGRAASCIAMIMVMTLGWPTVSHAQDGERVIAQSRAFDLLISSDRRLYYIDHFGGELGTLDAASGRKQPLLTNLRSPYHMTEFGNRIYFTEFGTGEGEYRDGALSVFDPRTGAHTRLREGLYAPASIEADRAGNLYVLEVIGTSTVFGGADRLLKFLNAGGDFEVLADDMNQVNPLSLLLDESHDLLYIGDGGWYSPGDVGALVAYSLTTGTPTTVLTGLPTVWDMEFDRQGNIVVAGFGNDGGDRRAVSLIPPSLDQVIPLRMGLYAWTAAPDADGSIYFATGRAEESIRVLTTPEPAALPLLALAGYALTRPRRRTCTG